MDYGTCWFDTSPVYGIGHSEEIVGKALKGKRSKRHRIIYAPPDGMRQ
ncbi:aldo/keto reductase [Blautia pseudococcoides]|nr:aldo/keto reductase [Blautia pseudococcoides]